MHIIIAKKKKKDIENGFVMSFEDTQQCHKKKAMLWYLRERYRETDGNEM